MNSSELIPTHRPASAVQIAATAVVAALIALTIIGNLLVCVSFYAARELRTLCNYFVVSLAVADILVALLAMPFWCALQLSHNAWTLGPALRRFWDCVDILCGTASIMNLTAVSIDRHYAITLPLSYPYVMTSTKTLAMIAGAWAYAGLVSGLRLVTWGGRSAYMYFVVCASFLLPLAIMLAMYLRIFAVARQQVKRISGNIATDIKAARTIAVVIGAFVICWSPFFVIVFGFSVSQSFPVPPAVYNAAKWLTYLNSCLNPVIYTSLNRAYRSAFLKLFLPFRRANRARANSNSSRNAARSSLTCDTALESRRSTATHSPSQALNELPERVSNL